MKSHDVGMPEIPKTRRICPFLGVMEDPDTSLAFPSELNFCHAAEPPAVPRFDHQADRCLALAYLSCPVYTSNPKGPLPAEFRLGTKTGGMQIKLRPSWLVRSVGAFVLASLIFFIGWFGVAGLNRSISQNQAAKTKAGLPVLFTSTPVLPPATPTSYHPPEQMVTPAASETPTPPLVGTPGQNTPPASCGRPAGWVNHIVQPGDTLYQLSLEYGVTVTQLQNANCMGASTILHTGQILYVPPGVQNPVYPTQAPTWPVGTYVPTNTYEWTPPEEVPTATVPPATVPPATEPPATEPPVTP